MELLREIESYWTTRTEGYSEVNQKELAGEQRENWRRVLTERFPKRPVEELKILDIGTGPGFFPVILAEAGYFVTAVDYTPGMLEKAKENAGALGSRITFRRMDAQELEFEDNTFDVIISRNLTWNLEEPARAYAEWFRVLKPGGRLLNFDANWYGYLYDEDQRAAYEEDRRRVDEARMEDHYLCTDIDRMEQIALRMPLSAIHRPVWDERVLRSIGFGQVAVDQDIWQRVWSREEKLNYGSTPMFMICAVKPERTVRERVTDYWAERSRSFLEQKRAELHSVMAERWMEEIRPLLRRETGLRILDVGCGAGFFSILLAKRGHRVTGIDLTPDMVDRARSLAAEERAECEFLVMDAERPDFPDDTFDVVISRNLTWTLPDVASAYRQWGRVLKAGGILVNMDADYGADNMTDTSKLPEHHAHDQLGSGMLRECEEIKQEMPISRFRRPKWDVMVLERLGFEEVLADEGLSGRVYRERDEFYNPTPMFLLTGRKRRD